VTTLTAPRTDDAPGQDARSGLPVYDVDVHEAFTSLNDLLPYLADPWKDLMARASWKGLTPPYVKWASGGGGRADSKPAGGGPPGSDYELMKSQLLDAYNIKKVVLTGYFYPVIMEDMQVELAGALASAYNDYQIDQWLSKDDRFLGSIQVAPQDPQAAAQEIDRVGGHPQMVQVMLATTTRAYGEPMYHPIYEAAQRNGLRVAFHQSTYVQGACGMGRYYIERHMLIPQATMSQCISLLCNGVFDHIPDLRFIALEGGFTWLPHVLWRMDREYKSLRQEIPWVKKLPSSYFRDDERMVFATQPTEDITAEEWLKVQELIGSEDLLVFATDYPHFDFDSPVRSLPARLPEDLKKKILFDTAERFYERS
jgi:predicted TIM-barrel fold metal-dependent hydrolase